MKLKLPEPIRKAPIGSASHHAAQAAADGAIRLPQGMMIFDIETGAQETAIFSFNSASVKVGNLKDPAKIAEKIDASREKFLREAALHAETAHVLAVGIIDHQGVRLDLAGKDGSSPVDEDRLISDLWERMSHCHVIIGHGIHNFDLPMLVRRSLILGVEVPTWVQTRGGRYFDNRFVDTGEIWLCGSRGTDTQWSLNHLASLFGLDQKIGHGGDFHVKWLDDTKEAEDYLRDDLLLTYLVARHMNVITTVGV